MCRIAGIVYNSADKALTLQKVKTMCKVLRHGGPDGEGIINAGNGVVFGHRRLSIIDLSNNGHQPMSDVNTRAWITFNGEIYNYPELKTQLISLGAVFKSNTDTEVIVQAYLHWGSEAFARLRGIFAFALYDSNKKLTYLVRDSMGVKPLYYHINKSGLSFASEVRAFRSAEIVTEEDNAWRIRFLAFGHVPEPCTTLKNVFSLPKGSILCWDNAKQTFKVQYYTQQLSLTAITNIDSAHKAIADVLTAAVKRQLIADAPVGVF